MIRELATLLIAIDQDRVVGQQINEVRANGDTVIGDGDCALPRDRSSTTLALTPHASMLRSFSQVFRRR
jgi:hypothetical protein